MTENIPAIFAIIGLRSDKTDRNIGTGFFINESGGFVTAAHTFKKASEGWTYFAIINKTPVPLDTSYIEYRDLGDQVAPIHQDLCLGTLNLEGQTEFLTFSPSEGLEENDILEFKGYASTLHTDEEPEEIVVPIESNIKMDDLWAEVENGGEDDQDDNASEEFQDPFEFKAAEGENEDKNEPKQVVFKLFGDASPVAPKEINLKDEIDKLQYSEITGSFIHTGFEKIFEKMPVEGIFTNGFTFALTNTEAKPSGLSGCPVLKSGKTTGMLFTKNGAISAEYIMAQLTKQEIQYYTDESLS